MNGSTSQSDNLPSAFKSTFKAYRMPEEQRTREGWAAPLDFDHLDQAHAALSVSAGLVDEVPTASNSAPWLKDARIYSIRGVDGFRFIRCPFSSHESQLRLAHAALSGWIEPPAANNLRTAAGVGQAVESANHFWRQHLQALEPPGRAASADDPAKATTLLSRLAWATVGYQYQWTERRYDRSKRSPMPQELVQLAAELAFACGWALTPEAAIINLYGHKSVMGGHLDDAEPCQSVPIVSISLGLEAIYVLGGRTKAEPALAMRLRSGDVVVQGGQSRGFVHGVPRILPATLPPELLRAGTMSVDSSGGGCVNEEGSELAAVARWLREHRLNINVRQVFDDKHSDHEREGQGQALYPESALFTPSVDRERCEASSRSTENTGRAHNMKRPREEKCTDEAGAPGCS